MILGVALVALLGGCASAPPATDTLAVARRSIERAEQAGAAQAAPAELHQARDKLKAAEKASTDREAKAALRLAQQADVDGRLAEVTASANRSREAAEQLEASLKALREESAREAAAGAVSASPP